MKDVPMTDEERQQVLQYEEGVIDKIKEENNIGGIEGLFAASEDAESKVYPITVGRDGRDFFTFEVRPLPIKEFDRLEKSNQVFEEDKQRGARKMVDFKTENYLAMIIFEATTHEHKKEFWSNPEVRKRFGTIGYQSVIKVLKAGEIEEIAGYIERISGRDNDLKLGETIKNSSEQEEK